MAVYSYNALGQRSLKLTYDPASGALQSGSVFYYGPSGELIGQTDYSGTTGQRLMTRYWLWLDSLPLAQVEVNYTQGAPSGGRILYLHPDHLNAPRIATSQQAIVWPRNSDAFGATLPNEDMDRDGVATHIPLRFPGQYYDAQTQLSYNYFRDYDANLGRYVQSDPIGLNGGVSTYIYVRANPVSGFDPLGLFDILSYSQWMNDHAHATSQHQCAKYVRQGLEAGGADTTGHPYDAKNYGPTLIGNGFTPISSDNYIPQAGDTVVFQPYPGGNQSGHIEMFNGERWVSDFNQNHFLPGIGYGNSTYQTYRAPNQ